MDRQRLKDVRQTDLTESRVNEDFVLWLKESGPTYLLVILIAVGVFIGVQRWKSSKQTANINAWQALSGASTPNSLKDVIEQYGDIDQIGNFARIRAADEYLGYVQTGVKPGTAMPEIDPLKPEDPNQANTPIVPEDEPITAEDRTRFLAEAERLYEGVVESDDQSRGIAIHVVNALFGLAAVAECRGDAETARQWYERAAERADGVLPGHAGIARERLADVDSAISAQPFWSQNEISRHTAEVKQREVLEVDDALRDLLPLEGSEDQEG
jgi:hypothetical protein